MALGLPQKVALRMNGGAVVTFVGKCNPHELVRDMNQVANQICYLDTTMQ